MIYNKCSTEDYKSPKINFGTITRNPENLKFVLDHFKIKKVCKQNVAKKISFCNKTCF